MLTRGVTWPIWIRLLDYVHFSTSSARKRKYGIIKRLLTQTFPHHPALKQPKDLFYDVTLERLRSGTLRPKWAECWKMLLLHDYYIMCPECEPCSICQPIKDKIVHWSHFRKFLRVKASTCTSSWNNNNNNYFFMKRNHKRRRLFSVNLFTKSVRICALVISITGVKYVLFLIWLWFAPTDRLHSLLRWPQS